jgi:UDP-glucose 4-epimerase
MSPYAAAKLSGELYCRVFANVYDLPVVVTRFFNVFGPRQVPDSPYSGVVAAFCLALLRGETPRIDGDGQQSRDFTFVGDVARGCILAMQARLPGCHVINLACGGSHSVLDILRGLQTHAGVAIEPVFAPARAGDVLHSRADVSLARELLGFAAEVSLFDGLELTYDWYRSVYA